MDNPDCLILEHDMYSISQMWPEALLDILFCHQPRETHYWLGILGCVVTGRAGHVMMPDVRKATEDAGDKSFIQRAERCRTTDSRLVYSIGVSCLEATRFTCI